MSEPNEEAPDGLGVFLSGDGRRSTDAPWRLQAYDRSGPLSALQIADLAHRFGLEAGTLAKLSERLGIVLDPSANIHVIPASRTKARQSAKSEIARAKRQLKAIEANLSDMIERLSSLISEDDDEESPYSPPYAEMLRNLESSLKAIAQAERTLQSLSGQPGALVRWEPLDKRELRDRRRDQVLGAIFQFWVDAGRKITFTTDKGPSKRGGKLVYFAQAVCAYLTEPPTEISAETIVRTIRTKGKHYSPMPEWALSIVNGQKSEP